jgi:hypothetical protein
MLGAESLQITVDTRATVTHTSIVERQGHINGLQKNMDTLREVKAALTGK